MDHFEIAPDALREFSREGGWSVGANFLFEAIKMYLLCAKKIAKVIDAFLMTSHRVFGFWSRIS